ncbi:hypothetical protein [Marivirga sp.]|uniref:hypothetical protein n=1 Tax=Marivirga sp. TaxID=2018662 RepID=UPI002D80CD86|nr:hypothetical protein [Marivirga sp.]HET8860526.1 hypothetical protein [Marivirga sp.]
MYKLIKCSFCLLILVIQASILRAQESKLDSISEQYVFYSPEKSDFGVISFLGKGYKLLLGNNSDLILMGEENLHLDTLNLKDNGVKGDLFSFMRFSNQSFSYASKKGSYFFRIVDDSIVLEESYSFRDIKKVHGKYTYANILPDGIIVFESDDKENEFQFTFTLYSKQLEKRTAFEVAAEKKSEENYYFYRFYPESLFYDGTNLYFSNVYDHELILMNLKSNEIEKLDYPKVKARGNIQDAYIDVNNNEIYLVEFGYSGNKQDDIHLYTFEKENFNYFNSTSISSSSMRCGISNGKIIIVGKFANDFAFYLVPLSQIHML